MSSLFTHFIKNIYYCFRIINNNISINKSFNYQRELKTNILSLFNYSHVESYIPLGLSDILTFKLTKYILIIVRLW